MYPPEVHLQARRQEVRPDEARWRAFPLGEADVPVLGSGRGLRELGIPTIVDHLAVETSARYQPLHNTTFCNVYAYDICCLAGVYLPRVWWTKEAMNNWRSGKAVDVLYGVTVTEVTCNLLFTWFHQFGRGFGWEQICATNLLQEAAEMGDLGLVVAFGDRKCHGHVSIVLPESAYQRSCLTENTLGPLLQTQAGRRNVTARKLDHWWCKNCFSGYAFWVWRS